MDMRSHINKLMTGLLWAVLSFSCTGADENAAGYGVADSKMMAEEVDASSSPIRVGEEAIPERKLTKNGMLRFETPDAQKTRAAIQKAVTEVKGYVASDSKDENDGRQTSTIMLRVPADQFDALVDRITADAGKIDYKNIEVNDVTQEYIDLDARLKTKKDLEARYQELLKRANSVDEVLKVEAQIGSLRAEIESAEGQMRYLKNQVALSTLTVSFYEKTVAAGFGYKFQRALRQGWDNLLWVVIGLTNLWAILLFVAIVWIVIARIRRKRKRKKTQA